MLDRAFYERTVITVAPALLGKVLKRRTPEGILSGIIVETEAYSGLCDAACHAYPFKHTPRTEILFGAGGYAYVYKIYGLYHCFNVVVNRPGQPEGVLIRALEPLEGIAGMHQNRTAGRAEPPPGKTAAPRYLCGGPGRLCQALALDRQDTGTDLCGTDLWIEPYKTIAPEDITVTPRINIDYAGAARYYPWRYLVKGNPYVSV